MAAHCPQIELANTNLTIGRWSPVATDRIRPSDAIKYVIKTRKRLNGWLSKH